MSGLYKIAHGSRAAERWWLLPLVGLLGCEVPAPAGEGETPALEVRSAGAHMALQRQAPGRDSGVATDPVADKVARRDARQLAEAGSRASEDAVVADDAADVAKAGSNDAVQDERSEPVATRIARQALTVRVAPRHRAGLRAHIPMGEAFEVFAFVDGEGEDRGCGGLGWAEVGGGYVCLERTRRAAGRAPRTLPKMRDRGRLPFYYAKVRKGRVAEQWSSVASYRAGAPSVRTLEAEHDYAFIARKIDKGELFLVDERRRVVPEKQMARFYPSGFSGVDLGEEPVVEGTALAWNVSWPKAQLRSAPSATAEVARALAYHEQLSINPEPVDGSWYRLADGSGYVHGGDIRRWSAPEPLPSAAAGEIWIDVDLLQQTLTVMRGKQPVFATLVSSGFKSPTPRGVFRIRMKQSTGTMSSSPGDSDVYAVEEVPHVQYFFNSFALHSAYWHNRFGHKMSHGCVNLSPDDARLVYEMTGPHPRDGWVDAYESEADLGTTVRIRNGDEDVRDRRGPVVPVTG